jgi:hypothetical protein
MTTKLMWAEKAPHYETIIDILGSRSDYQTSMVVLALFERDLDFEFYAGLVLQGCDSIRFLRVVSHPVHPHVN